ncbi:MAG: hypothetical protein CYPHOPRED_005105, partial [Cyphobasidiales sp. Tagirdzhanova-0007]
MHQSFFDQVNLILSTWSETYSNDLQDEPAHLVPSRVAVSTQPEAVRGDGTRALHSCPASYYNFLDQKSTALRKLDELRGKLLN